MSTETKGQPINNFVKNIEVAVFKKTTDTLRNGMTITFQSKPMVKTNRPQTALKWNEWNDFSVPHIQPIRPLAALEEHCWAVVFYWSLDLLKGLVLLRKKMPNRKPVVHGSGWAPLSFPANHHIHIFLRLIKLGARWGVKSHSTSLNAVLLLYLHRFFMPSLPLCLFWAPE